MWGIMKEKLKLYVLSSTSEVEYLLPSLLGSMTSLMLIILVGYYAGNTRLVSEAGNKTLVSLLLNVTLPVFIVYSFVSGSTDEVRDNVLRAFFYSGAAFALVIAFSHLLVLPIKGPRRTILHFSNVFPNTGFIGFPLLLILYGPEGVVYGSIFNMVGNILSWSYGLYLFEKASGKSGQSRSFLAVLKNPNLIAVIVGLILLFLRVELPEILLRSMSLVSGITSPLSMIVIGVIMAYTSFSGSLSDWKLYYALITKLLAVPLLLIGVGRLLGLSFDLVLRTVIIIHAMPTAAIASILSEQYAFERDFATLIVVMTTLLMIATIPLILLLL